MDRFHRVAESAALISLAGFETCPYRLPQLQMVTIHKVVTDTPSFYISKELKYVGDDDWYDRPEKSPRRAGGAGSAESVIKTDAEPVSIILFRPYGTKLASWREKWENMLWSPAVRVPIGM